jgi:hypothetical protein
MVTPTIMVTRTTTGMGAEMGAGTSMVMTTPGSRAATTTVMGAATATTITLPRRWTGRSPSAWR